jgi:hypothetical protein
LGGGRNRSSSSLFPDDAQYIGYLSDDERVNIDDNDDTLANIVRRRRRELLGTDGDISFSGCLLFVVVVVLLVVVWGGSVPRGFRPPTAGYCSAKAERCDLVRLSPNDASEASQRSVATTFYEPMGAPPRR